MARDGLAGSTGRAVAGIAGRCSPMLYYARKNNNKAREWAAGLIVRCIERNVERWVAARG